MALIGNTANPKPSSPFFWGQGGRQLTPEQIAREREIAAALMQSGADYSPVAHWAQGLARVAQAGVGAFKDWRATQDQEAGMQSARDKYGAEIAALLGGGAPVQTASIDPVAAALVGEPQTAVGVATAMGAPSAYSPSSDPAGFDWSRYAVGGAAARPDSFTGLDQAYASRVADMLTAADAELGPGALKITSAYRSPELQAQLYQDAIAKYGSEQAARKWVAPPGRSKHNSGLAVDFANSQGSLLRDADSREAQWIAQNAGRFGLSVPMSWEPWQVELPRDGASPAPAQVARAGGISPTLVEAMSDPWARELYGPALDAAFKRQLEQQDPMYQLQMQQAQQGLAKGELEIQALLNPPVPAPEYGFAFAPDGTLIRTDKTSGTFDPMGQFGTPDDGMTDTQINLSWRAEQAGLVPGTPEYAEFMRSGGQSTGMALTVGPDGTVQFSQGGGPGGKVLTEAQSKDAVYATRASGALPEVDRLEQSLLSFGEYAAGNLPMGLGNYMRSEDYQVASNAGKEFLASILRKDTGAAVTPSEEQMYGDIFLPRPGDKPATLARKRQARALAVEAIKAGMPPQAIQNMANALEAAGLTDGSDAPATTGTEPPPNQSQPRVVTQQEYQSLPSGSPFIAADDPSRTVRIKP